MQMGSAAIATRSRNVGSLFRMSRMSSASPRMIDSSSSAERSSMVASLALVGLGERSAALSHFDASFQRGPQPLDLGPCGLLLGKLSAGLVALLQKLGVGFEQHLAVL